MIGQLADQPPVVRNHAICHRQLPAETSIDDVFSMSAAAGFSAVELSPLSDPADVKAALDASARAGVGVSAVACRHRASSAYFDRDGDELDRNINVALTALRNAADLGASTVLVTPGQVNATTSAEESWRRSADVIATSLVPTAAALGVVLGIENTWNSFLLTAKELAQFVDEQRSPSVGAYFDAGNVFFGHPEHWVAALGARIVGVHDKDYLARSRSFAGYYRFAVPGSGDIDWLKFDLALADVGYGGWLTHAGVPPPFRVVLANRVDRELAPRRGGLARGARSALASRRRHWHERQLNEMRRSDRERDRVLFAALHRRS